MPVYSVSCRKQQPDMLEGVMISSMSPAADDMYHIKRQLALWSYDQNHYPKGAKKHRGHNILSSSTSSG